MRTTFTFLALVALAVACNSNSEPSPDTTPSQTTEYTVSTVAGSDTEGYQDGKGPSAQFYGATSLLCDPQGNVYIADQGNHRIRKMTPDGTVTTVAGGGPGDGWDANKDPLKAALHRPKYLALATNGDLLISEAGDRYYDKSNVLFRTLSTTNGIANYLYANPPASFDKQNYNNGGVVQDKAGNYYLLEAEGIRKISPQGVHTPNWVTGIDTRGDQLTGNLLAIDTQGSLYFPSGINSWLKGEITKVAPDGSITYLKGGPVGSKLTEGKLSTVNLGFVRLLTVDNQNNLYVVNSGKAVVFDQVIKISPEGMVTFLAGGSGEGYVDGKGKEAHFQRIAGLAVDGKGTVYVADYGRIRTITPSK
ncbi:hypothetical protein ACFSUS_24565 [Spirosoma soli]|uniref:NHL repeat-containing protein n=1 Tax=Spirosoma soli TaxID=1770529 RepID=A0ABW5MA26_9BACT